MMSYKQLKASVLSWKLFVVFLIFCAGVTLMLHACSKTADKEAEKYLQDVEAKRRWKNEQFRHSGNSPLTPEQRMKFRELNYFPVDIAYRVEATFVDTKDPVRFKIRTSTGEERLYAKIGELRFGLGWGRYSLMAYQAVEMSDQGRERDLFVPFTDKTTAGQSYGGGRYLEVHVPQKGGTVVLDFNLAYNPYCAYNLNYSCPIPPRENHLPIKILAGEKIFK